MSEEKVPYTSGDSFAEALKPENWTSTTVLHTPTLEARLLDNGRLELMLLFADGYHVTQVERSDVEALTRFLDQYANVQPLPAPEDPFADFQPTKAGEENPNQ